MNMINSKSNRTSYFYIIVILLLTFPIFKYYISSLVFVFCWTVSISIAIIFLKNYFKSNLFACLLFYTFLVVLNFLTGDAYFYSSFYAINEFFMLFITTSMAYFFLPNITRSKCNLLLLLFGLFLIESSIVTFYATIEYPGLLRRLSTEENTMNNMDILAPYFRMGMSDYSIPHALPIIIPGLIYAIRRSNYLLHKFFYIAILVASVILANSSGSVTALLLSLLSLVLSLIIGGKSIKRSKIRIVVALIIFMPFFLNQSLQLNVFETIGKAFPENNYLQTKTDDIKASIVSDVAQGSVAAREEKYELTFDAIVDNFFIGTNEKFGGHSTIPDRWATLGIVGFIPYILFIVFSIKYVLKFIRGSNLYYYYIGAGIALLLLLTKSMGTWPVWFSFLFLLPYILVYFNKDTETCKLKE